MKIFLSNLLIGFVLLFFTQASCQQSGVVLHREYKENFDKQGKDSLNRRQGEWQIPITYFAGYIDSAKLVEGFERGFYIDDLKEGFWEVVDSNYNLIAHIFYVGNKSELEILYFKNKIYAIYKWRYFNRPNNLGLLEQSYPIEHFEFDREGFLRSRKFFAPDGIPEEKKYHKYSE